MHHQLALPISAPSWLEHPCYSHWEEEDNEELVQGHKGGEERAGPCPDSRAMLFFYSQTLLWSNPRQLRLLLSPSSRHSGSEHCTPCGTWGKAGFQGENLTPRSLCVDCWEKVIGQGVSEFNLNAACNDRTRMSVYAHTHAQKASYGYHSAFSQHPQLHIPCLLTQ